MIRLSDAATLYHADCREALKALPDNSLDSCCTDPPYALVSVVKRFGGANAAPAKGNDAYMRASAGFMGKQWDTGETAFSIEFWAEVYRVLKPGAFVAAFGASRGYHRMACAIEDAGFEIRDSLMWIYGTGFPKSQNVSAFIDKELGAEGRKGAVSGRSSTKEIGTVGHVGGEYHEYLPASPQAAEWEGWGTALKPAFEPIVLARKPLSEPTVAANVLRWRTGALNIGACRVGSEARTYDLKGNAPGSKTLNQLARGDGNDNPDAKAGGSYGVGSKQISIGTTTATGRWPANVVHDGSDEVVGMFPNTKSGAWNEGMQQRATDGVAKGAEQARVRGAREPDAGSAARFFYSAKASKADRNGSKHPTVKPIALMEWLAKLITPPGGTILDPFAGSGTTGIAATRCGFKAILCEREAEYVADIQARFGVGIQRLPLIASPPLVPLAPCPVPLMSPPPY